MDKQQLAASFHAEGYGCAQAVLASFAADYGLDESTALRLATGFGSGMGRMCEVCGALTGAFMVIGLKHGKSDTDGHKYGSETETTYQLVSELAQSFEQRNGSIYCRELLGYDLASEEQQAEVVASGLFETACSSYIGDAVELLETMLGPGPDRS